MKKLLNAWLFCLACAGLVGTAWGEKADRNKPLNVESDAMRYDDLQQVTVFTGRVLMTKGTIVIRGAQIDVREDPEGYQYGLVTGSAKDPAFFGRNVKPSKSLLKAKATPSFMTAKPIRCASSQTRGCAVCGAPPWLMRLPVPTFFMKT